MTARTQPASATALRFAERRRRPGDWAVRRAVREAAEAWRNGRAAAECMATIADALEGRFPEPGGEARRAPVLTERMRGDLRTLGASRPFGCGRIGQGWRGTGGQFGLARADALVRAGLARVDNTSRPQRLKISTKGRDVLAGLDGSEPG